MTINFDSKLNVIIGANGRYKTTIIDAIRLFYSMGEQKREIEVTLNDFHVEKEIDKDGSEYYRTSDTIKIVYTFDGLSEDQKAALYQYLVIESSGMLAHVELEYKLESDKKISFSYVTGNKLKADYETFQYFKAHYLGALRDSTRDLLSTRDNLLGKVIKRKVDKSKKEDEFKGIIERANKELLEKEEVKSTEQGINNNLRRINRSNLNRVGLHIEQRRLEYIVNAIKPYLPFDGKDEDGFDLSQNSLGFNNLIYISSVLSDISDCHEDDPISSFLLLIEEPEAHLHPQLQMNLYNFLKTADRDVNSQTFITSHSPTLVSKIPLENLIIIEEGSKAICIGDCFKDRIGEKIIKDAQTNDHLTEKEIERYSNMLTRYLTVTRSQLFFSNGCIFIEGISESQLLEAFSKIKGDSLLDNQIEIVNVGGIAFYQFLLLFNSTDPNKRIAMKAAFVTDEDQFPDSKKSNLSDLVADNYKNLNKLRKEIDEGDKCSRVKNMEKMANSQTNIKIASGKKTLEYQICLANVFDTIKETKESLLYRVIDELKHDAVNKVSLYMKSLSHDILSQDEKENIAILLWKCLPEKAEFAQNLAYAINDALEKGNKLKFEVPNYLMEAIHFVQS